MSEASPRLVAALAALTFVTGLVDAASVLGLGHVFVANMTGNMVFVGFSLFAKRGVSLLAGALALCGFLGGAVIGGRSVRRAGSTPWPALVMDVVLLLIAGLLSAFRLQSEPYLSVFLLAAAMGIRTAVVRHLAIPDMTTTVLTLTLAGIAADSSLAGGKNPRLGRRLLSVLCMLLGAAAGAFLLSRVPAFIILVAGILEGGAVLWFYAGRAGAASLAGVNKPVETQGVGAPR
jgi:uncharacterized membrane protein YoaK (UPF0700 family)